MLFQLVSLPTLNPNSFYGNLYSMNHKRNYIHLRFSILILSGILSFSSCTLNRAFHLTPIGNQSIHPHGNHSALVSLLRHTGVGAYLYFNENNDLALYLIYSNRSGRPLFIYPEKISMTSISKSGKRNPIKVYSAQEYIQQLQSEFAVAQIEASMEGAMEATTLQEESFVLRYSKNELHRITNPRTNSENGQFQGRLNPGDLFVQNQIIDGIRQPLLTKKLLSPNQYAEGNVMVKYKKAASYEINIPFGEETHIFHFSRK